MMPRPERTIRIVPPSAAAAAWAVVLGARSVRAVQRACGWGSPSTAHLAVRMAMQEGLVAQDRHKNGTLRPRVGNSCTPLQRSVR